jgi:hypothetical protein
MLTITRDYDVLRGLVLLRANTPQSLVDLVLVSQIPLLPVNITSTIVGYTIPILTYFYTRLVLIRFYVTFEFVVMLNHGVHMHGVDRANVISKNS